MARIRLEHYNLKTRHLAETVAFYTRAVGLREGFYPGAELGPGAWLYDTDGTPVVHMQEVTDATFEMVATRTEERLGSLRKRLVPDDLDGTGTIDHIAFACDDIDGFRARLHALGVAFRENAVVAAAVRQIFLRDPNGIILELNFRD
jgi:catechol 2,3-dioxygenase-like lactoylglutathione lyase family enzyme